MNINSNQTDQILSSEKCEENRGCKNHKDSAKDGVL